MNDEAKVDVVDLQHRIAGLEYAQDHSIPALIGALVHHLGKTGVINIEAFEQEVREEFSTTISEDSTGFLLKALADLAAAYRHDGFSGSRYEPVFELTVPN